MTSRFRTILHCDMNNFYASVECRNDPTLRGRPVAVCGETEERHGIVLAKSYEAKAFGIITGEPVCRAKAKCPDLVIVPPHYDEYVKVSNAARAIYAVYTDQIEPMGLDECWLDVTASHRLFGTGEDMAHAIRERIKAELGVTVSVGVSFNKVFAKLGSDMRKPDAVTSIPPDSFREVVWHLPVGDMLGVGHATAQKLLRIGVHTIGDLAGYPVECLETKFGKCGAMMWRFANGLDTSAVVAHGLSDLDKTTGHGITTLADLTEEAEVWPVLLELSQGVAHRLYVYERRATGVMVTVRDNTLCRFGWQCRLPRPMSGALELARAGFALFCRRYDWLHPIRSITIRAIDLIDRATPYQMTLFDDPAAICRREILDRTVEELRARFGDKIIRNAVLLHSPKMPAYDVLYREVQGRGDCNATCGR